MIHFEFQDSDLGPVVGIFPYEQFKDGRISTNIVLGLFGKGITLGLFWPLLRCEYSNKSLALVFYLYCNGITCISAKIVHSVFKLKLTLERSKVEDLL